MIYPLLLGVVPLGGTVGPSCSLAIGTTMHDEDWHSSFPLYFFPFSPFVCVPSSSVYFRISTLQENTCESTFSIAILNETCYFCSPVINFDLVGKCY